MCQNNVIPKETLKEYKKDSRVLYYKFECWVLTRCNAGGSFNFFRGMFAFIIVCTLEIDKTIVCKYR